VPFLLSLEYPLLPKTEDEMDSFVRAVADGESEQVYSMLLYCLDNHSNLCEMAYLSKFITSVQIPLDITMTQRDEGLSDLAKRYQSLQQELHTLFGHHKAAKKEEEQWDETCRKNDLKTLQNERTVLHEKVREMEDRLTKNTESFGQLVMAASILRKEQDTQARLSERMEEQQRARKPNEIKLDNIESRLDTFQSLYGTRTGGVMNMTTVLNGLRREVTESTMIVRSDLVSDRSKLEAKIKQLERLNDRPPCTVEDLERVLSLKRNLEAEIDIKSKLLKEEEATNSHPNIEMFKKVRISFSIPSNRRIVLY
jgi:chromosome segregation ATPase